MIIVKVYKGGLDKKKRRIYQHLFLYLPTKRSFPCIRTYSEYSKSLKNAYKKIREFKILY